MFKVIAATLLFPVLLLAANQNSSKIDISDNSCSEVMTGLDSKEIKNTLAELFKQSKGSNISIHPAGGELNSQQLGPVGDEIVNQLNSRMIGHPALKFDLAQAVQRAATGTNNASKPIASFFLLGITGTGKSLTGEVLHESLGFDIDEIISVDCSEMQKDHEISKLTGSPSGYIGHGSTPPLITEKILQKNTSDKYKVNVVIFDEIEKASPALLKLLLGVLDKGRLSTGTNSKINFKNSIVIFTSNLGQVEMNGIINEKLNSIGFSSKSQEPQIEMTNDRIKAAAMNAVKNKLSPEFRNRIDKTYVFTQYSDEEAQKILSLTLSSVQSKSFLRNKNTQIFFNLTPEGRSHLLKEGYKAEFGGRSINRAIENLIVEPLTNMLASKQLKNGDVINIGVKKGASTLEYQKVASNLSKNELHILFEKTYGSKPIIPKAKSVSSNSTIYRSKSKKFLDFVEKIEFQTDDADKLDDILSYIKKSTSLTSSEYLDIMDITPMDYDYAWNKASGLSNQTTNELLRMGVVNKPYLALPNEPVYLVLLWKSLGKVKKLLSKDKKEMEAFLEILTELVDDISALEGFGPKFVKDVKTMVRLKHEAVMALPHK